jgi:hypothetical protein
MGRLLTVLVAVALPACEGVSGPEPTPPLEAARLMAHVDALAHDSMLGRGATSVEERQAAGYVREHFRDLDLDPGVPDYFQTFAVFGDPNRRSQNVLGVLPGEGDLADEWIVVGAHYDHVGFQTVTADSIEVYNGADDNASGTSVMMELARYLAHYFTRGEGGGTDRRSILFQAFGAEEVGLVGSFYFCNHPTIPLSSVAAMLNLDMVGRLRMETLTVIGSPSSPDWPGILAAANDGGLTLAYEQKFISGSDHYCFYQAGRPVAFLFTGLHEQYHTPDDDPPLINAQGMLAVANLALGMVVDLATRPEGPAPVPVPTAAAERPEADATHF